MNEFIKHWRFQRILQEAASYRMLRDQYLVQRRSAQKDHKFADILHREFAVVDTPAFDDRLLD